MMKLEAQKNSINDEDVGADHKNAPKMHFTKKNAMAAEKNRSWETKMQKKKTNQAGSK